MNRSAWWFKIGLRYLITPVGLSLAAWQLKRHYWKQNLLKEIESAMSGEPIPYEDGEIEYNRVYRINEAEIGSKTPLKVGPKGIRADVKSKIIFSNAIICPVTIGSKKLLLHLGWLPIDKPLKPLQNFKDLKLIRERDEPSGFIVKNDPFHGIWRVKDILQLSRHFKTEPILLRNVGNPVQEDLIVKEIDINEIPNRHMEYVFTWTGLSLVAFIFSFVI